MVEAQALMLISSIQEVFVTEKYTLSEQVQQTLCMQLLLVPSVSFSTILIQ